MKVLADNMIPYWDHEFDVEHSNEKWNRDEENVVIRMTSCGHISRESAREIIDALDKWRATMRLR